MAVLISHRFSTVRMADRILVLDDGEILEAGHASATGRLRRPLRRAVRTTGGGLSLISNPIGTTRRPKDMPTVDSLMQDLRYAVRTLRRDAGFATLAIVIVGAGIAGTSTVFSLLNAVLLRPLPFRDPASLVWVPNGGKSGLSGQTIQVGHFLDLRQQAKSFSDLGAYFAFYGVGDFTLAGQGDPERLSAVPVTDNFFPVLGVQPQIGRLFTAEECTGRGPRAVLLSHGLSDPARSTPSPRWQAADVNAEPYTIYTVACCSGLL